MLGDINTPFRVNVYDKAPTPPVHSKSKDVVVKLVTLIIAGFVGGAASNVVTTTGGKSVGIPISLIA